MISDQNQQKDIPRVKWVGIPNNFTLWTKKVKYNRITVPYLKPLGPGMLQIFVSLKGQMEHTAYIT